MGTDLKRAEIRPPHPDEWAALCDLLAEIFPIEHWLWPEVAAHRIRLYRWQSLCMFLGAEIVGHVARMDIPVWIGGRVTTVAGVASVATPARWRRRGIAGKLLTELMKDVDRDAAPAALFTGVPRVYEGCGFRVVPQQYRAVTADSIPTDDTNYHAEEVERLDAGVVSRMDRIYSGLYHNHDGKVARDPDYWQWYALQFNHAQGKRIIFCRRDGRDLGYVRTEEEPEQLLVSELCCDERDGEVLGALLCLARREAKARGKEEIRLALPASHGLWLLCANLGIVAVPMPASRGETFMVRGVRGARTSCLDGIPWSLADKF